MAYDVVRAIHGGNVDGRRLATACVVGKVGKVREVGGWLSQMAGSAPPASRASAVAVSPAWQEQ